MSIDFSCVCGKRYRAEDRHAGKRWICPACNRELFVPGGAQPPPLPSPVEVAASSVERAKPARPPEDQQSYELGSQPSREQSRPFWKDPVVVVGAAVPTLILVCFFTYLAVDYSARAFRERVHALREEADSLSASQYRSAFEKYEKILAMTRGWGAGDRELSDDIALARKAHDRLYPGVKRELEREQAELRAKQEAEQRAKQEAERLAAVPKRPVVEPPLVPDYTDWRLGVTFAWDVGEPNCVTFSPDGRTLAVGGGIEIPSGVNGVPPRESGVLRLWDVATKAAKLSVTEPNNQFGSVVFYPDGTALAIGDRSQVQIIDPTTGALKIRIPINGDVYSYPIAINQRYKILTIKGYDFWDSESGEPKPHPSPFDAGTDGAVFSNDGSFYYVGSVVFTVRPWTRYLEVDRSEPRPVAFSHDATLIATPMSVWSLKERKLVWSMSPAPRIGMAFTPDDRFLLTGHQDGEFTVHDVVTGTLAGRFWLGDGVQAAQTPAGKPEHLYAWQGVAFAPDCRALATISSVSGQSVRVWRVAMKPAS
jgi:hypothetical protein